MGNRTLTGIKPTGTLHLGNLIGAILPVIKLAETSDETFVFIADLHALNFVKDSKTLQEDSYKIAASFLALGLNLEKAVLFRQSDIAEVSQLSSLLMNVTPKGLMNRAHSYKAMVENNKAENQDPDFGVNMGLYTYPVLMAADILLYDSDLVPVGKDQKQHVEFARDIAQSFNFVYQKDFFKLPQPVISEETATIPGLDGRKMSKSYQNVIPIFSTEKELEKNIMKIITDSKRPEEPKNPEENTIFQLYCHFATVEETASMKDAFLNGKIGYGDAKKELFRVLNAYLKEPREKYFDLLNHPEKVNAVLQTCADKARAIAAQKLAKAKKLMIG